MIFTFTNVFEVSDTGNFQTVYRTLVLITFKLALLYHIMANIYYDHTTYSRSSTNRSYCKKTYSIGNLHAVSTVRTVVAGICVRGGDCGQWAADVAVFIHIKIVGVTAEHGVFIVHIYK